MADWADLRGDPEAEARATAHALAGGEWRVMALAESRNEFYARVLPRLGRKLAPSLKKKRGASKEVLMLRDEVRALKLKLTKSRERTQIASKSAYEVVERQRDAAEARVRELEGILNIVETMVA